jgi:hypothetical protein
MTTMTTLSSGILASLQGTPMEPIAIAEAQEWVERSHLLNRALAEAPGGY